MDAAGEGEGVNRESSVGVCTLSCVTQMASGKLPCGTGAQPRALR